MILVWKYNFDNFIQKKENMCQKIITKKIPTQDLNLDPDIRSILLYHWASGSLFIIMYDKCNI